MIFVFDNNLPSALAKSLDALTKSQFPHHSVCHITDLLPASTPDEDWIEYLSTNVENYVVITHDKLTKGLEREVLRRVGLKVFMLNKTWRNHKFWDKAVNITRWWPRIVNQAEGVFGGAAFSVGWNFSGKGKFEVIKL